MPRFPRPRSPVHAARQSAAALLTLLALVLALRPTAPSQPAGGPADVAVVVSARDLPAGTTLTADDVTTGRYPADAATARVAGDPAQLMGRVLAGGVRAREPITDARLVGPGVTALLPEGQVAAPVRLADLAVAALVRTGDRVDVLATAPDASTADVVAAGALVLATSGAGAGSGAGAASVAGVDSRAGLLLLGVDAGTAARLAAAATTATLTVNLPPP